jgi:hypothetical protein
MPIRSFTEAGFHCNPFRALTREEWTEIAVLPESVRRAEGEGGHLQILGGAGSGKTTALLALCADYRRREILYVYEYLPPGSRRFTSDPSRIRVFLLDESQRLSRAEQSRLVKIAKAGTRLILSTHEDFTAAFHRARLVLHNVELSCPEPAELAALLRRRLERFSIGPLELRFSPDAVTWLREEFGGNMRTMEYFLYDYFQAARPSGTIGAGPLQEALGAFTPPEVAKE